MGAQGIMANIQMLERERTNPRKRSDLVMTHIKFLHICEIFELAQSGQRVERQYENFDVFEGADEAQTSDFEVGKIGELQDRRVFNVEFFNVEIILAFEQQILVELVEKRRPAEAILEVVDEHDFESAQIKPIQLVGLDLQIWVVLLVDALELVRTYLLNQSVVDIVYVFLEGVYIFRTDKVIIVGLEQGNCISEISHFVLVGIIQHVIILY